MRKDFLTIADWSSDELKHLIHLAEHLKIEWQSGGNRPVLAGKALGMIFQKPSLRTRVSFDMAMFQLGGHALMLSPQEIGLGQRESIPDVARVLSSMVQGIMARVFAHAHVEELSKWSRVPVINGLSDYSHPCQAMADFLTVKERFGRLEGLKLAYIGDGNNVATSLLFAAAKFGVDFAIATPKGYELPQAVVDKGKALAQATGISVQITENVEEAAAGAHVLYTDTWTSMGQEAEAEARRKVFAKYQINDELLKVADKNSIVLHCLPAHRGEEITDSVADGAHSAIFQQAENRLHAQKAILVHLMAN